MKGIILAGGVATRLFPVTRAVSKQLLPVYDKPMVYYPLSTLMLAGVQDIAIITTPRDSQTFQNLLGDGKQWGINLSYIEQPSPDGIAQAFLIGKNFIDSNKCVLILGDNIFFGQDFSKQVQISAKQETGATLFCHWNAEPSRYGVIEFDGANNPIAIVEKPKSPKSNWIVTGLYFYDESVVDVASNQKPSARGELEITDVNNVYLAKGTVRAEKLSRGTAWFDAGTHQALLQASQFIYSVEEQQGQKIACLEEIAFRMGFIDAAKLEQLADEPCNNLMRSYLRQILRDPKLAGGF